MNATRDELHAAQALGEAILKLLMAREIGMRHRGTYHNARPDAQISGLHSLKPVKSAGDEVDKLLVTAREAARLLGISNRTLWSMTAPRGPIQSVRIGRTVRYAVDDLRDAIDDLKRKGLRT